MSPSRTSCSGNARLAATEPNTNNPHMNNKIKMEVLETMAEGAGSPAERYELRMRLETIHYEELRSSECKKQAILGLILFVLIGIFVSLNLKLLASPSLSERPSASH